MKNGGKMEIKLYVMTHKEKIGSTIYATSNMLAHEIEVIEAATSRRNKSSEYEMKEKNNGGYWVYFFSYKGGKDEFGRDYQEVVASIFNYRLTVTEAEKLRKIFYRIKNEISNKSFSIEKSKFVGIKRRDGVDRFKDNRFNQWKKHIIFAGLVVLMVVCAGFIYKYAKENPEKFKIINQIKDYSVKRAKITLEGKDIYKYRENIKLIEKEVNSGNYYFNNSKKELTPEFYERIKEMNNSLTETIEGIKEELTKAEMSDTLTAAETDENRRYVQIEKSVQEYNSEINPEKLKKIKVLCEQYLEKYSSVKGIKVKYYLNKIEKILSGEKNVNINVDIFTKNSSSLVWKKVEMRISPQDKLIKREIEANEGKKISKVKLKMKYDDSIYIKLYLVEEDDKKLIASFGIKVEEMTKENKISVGDSEFYLKLNPDFSDFIL